MNKYVRLFFKANGQWINNLTLLKFSTDITNLPLTQAINQHQNTHATLKTEDDSNVKVTTLSNGLRVASQQKFGMHCTIGAMVNAGPRHEVNYINGISHFIEKLGFHSTDSFKDRDAVQEKLERCSAIFDCQISRDFTVYAISGINKHIDTLTHVLSESLLRPKISQEEVRMAAQAIGFELATMEMAPPVDPILMELMHCAAYMGNNTLGLARYCPKQNSEIITRKHIMEFMASLFKPERTVLVGVGVDHDEFVRSVETHFLPWITSYGTEYPEKVLVKPDASVPMYRGGEMSVNRDLSQYHAPMPEFVHCAIGFQACGSTDSQFVTSCLLNSLLGGGGSFSAGGPGKGMYTRLYVNLLNQHYWINSAQAANHIYMDSGLFTISGSCEPEDLDKLVNVIVNEIRYTAEAPILANEMERAKKQLESMLLMNLEMRPVSFEDIARQILCYGEWKNPVYWGDKISKVTTDDLHEFVHRMLNSPPTMVGYGRMDKWPSFEEVSQALVAPFGTSKTFSERFPSIFKRFV